MIFLTGDALSALVQRPEEGANETFITTIAFFTLKFKAFTE